MTAMALLVSELYIYPIKSLGGISLTSSTVDIRGLDLDRRWMLIDDFGRCITQREAPVMATLRVEVLDQTLLVYPVANVEDNILIPFITMDQQNNYPLVDVALWDDKTQGRLYPSSINAWFSNKLKMESRLVYMDDTILRPVDPTYAQDGEITSFSDGYPILILGQSAMDALNGRLEESLPINRFRPNIVFTGGHPHQEDEMDVFNINGVTFYGVKLCARCNVPTIDQDTGVTNSEPTATLATYRLIQKKILFGQNVLIRQKGTIHVGDAIILP